jgi:periplasmic divalent cation tolerance protein
MADAAPSDPFVVILVTVPDPECGERIARALLDERLAACVNRIGPIHSLYRWEGKVEAADEHLLVIKTRGGLRARIETAVAKLHPYEVPEVVALPIAGGSARYLAWIAAETAH